jgi:hypothetical protein
VYKEDDEMRHRYLLVIVTIFLLFLGALPLIGQASAPSASVLHGDAERARAPAGPFYTMNVAQHRPTYCSSIENTCRLCRYAVDGKPTTRWSSQFEDPQWIYVDLGRPTRIDRVILRWETAFARAYQIQMSNDATAWTTVYSTTDGDGGVDDLAVTGIGRFVRMLGTQRGTVWGYSLFEFEVYGSSSTMNLPLTLNRALSIPVPTPVPVVIPEPLSVLVDDYGPGPMPGQRIYPYNRLDGSRSALNDSVLDWSRGQITMTIAADKTWGGISNSLNHPLTEALSLDFSAILPQQIRSPYQSRITGVSAKIVRSTAGRTFRLEIKDHGEWRWHGEATLEGEEQAVTFDLPALGTADELVWVMDGATGDKVVLDSIAFTATNQITDTATAAFVWSLSQLLSNWNPDSGLVRDRGEQPAGHFDAVQASGALAAATAQAVQLGIISRGDAVEIVNRIGDALLVRMPRKHGLMPHFVRVSSTGVITIAPVTEFSLIDTAIATVGLLTAQSALDLDTAATEQLLRDIDWEDLLRPGGFSMGYDCHPEDECPVLDVFGAEAWLVELAYAAARREVAALAYPAPPTVSGGAFLDEMHLLFVPPPVLPDFWLTDWATYRAAAAERQIQYFRSNYPMSCFARLWVFGLSSTEGPDMAQNIYIGGGVGGRNQCANDGSQQTGALVVMPHASALYASVRPMEALQVWEWLIEENLFTPLNNVESLSFMPSESCDQAALVWNSRKLSWNIALQSLGLGRFLAERQGERPILWKAIGTNAFLTCGYQLLAPNDPVLAPNSASIQCTAIGR